MVEYHRHNERVHGRSSKSSMEHLLYHPDPLASLFFNSEWITGQKKMRIGPPPQKAFTEEFSSNGGRSRPHTVALNISN
jgi:hypothetical protein